MKKLYLAAMLASSSGEAFSQTAVASWYDQPGITASGERYDPKKLTAAHRTLPFGTVLLLRKGDKKVRVKITDRGPFVKGRHLDLSKAAAKHLGVSGVEKVEIISVEDTYVGFYSMGHKRGRLSSEQRGRNRRWVISQL